MKPTGPSPAIIIFNPDGLTLNRIPDIYLESHTVVLKLPLTIVLNALKLNRENNLFSKQPVNTVLNALQYRSFVRK